MFLLGKGLNIVANVIEGDYLESTEEIKKTKKVKFFKLNSSMAIFSNLNFQKALMDILKEYTIDGFANISASHSTFHGVAYQ